MKYGKVVEFSYSEILKDSLSEFERSVFKQWGINGDTTTLKVQTATEISENAMYYFEAERAKKRTSIGNFLKNIFV